MSGVFAAANIDLPPVHIIQCLSVAVRSGRVCRLHFLYMVSTVLLGVLCANMIPCGATIAVIYWPEVR